VVGKVKYFKSGGGIKRKVSVRRPLFEKYRKMPMKKRESKQKGKERVFGVLVEGGQKNVR